jgi:small subunit ribosomal protein S4
MIRKKKLFARPRKAYEISRIKEENSLMKEYGLKNKKEIWKTQAKVNYFRRRAKALAKASMEEQNVFFSKLQNLGLNTNTIADVLALKIRNLLDRRLPTIVLRKGLVKTMGQARQYVVHKKVMIKGSIVNSPSYIVPVSEEKLISLKLKVSKPKAETKPAVQEAKPEEAQ